MFSLRIVTTSHYQAKPIAGLDTTHSEFRNCAVKRVPVLRIFGSTPAGQKTCMHIHGVFPYLYVPYDGTQPADRYLRQFAASLDKALSVANRSTNSSFQHVYKISLVSGIPMYGYHPQEECFLKIYLFNPTNIRKAADLLLGGAVMNKPFQPHESHIPYTLQLFMDYNLYGMNFINVAALKFRKRTQDDASTRNERPHKVDTSSADKSILESSSASLPSSADIMDYIWNEENIPRDLWLPDSIEKQSTCELEVDVVAADITNRQELTSNIGANPGLTFLWEDEKQRRRDALEPSQLDPESSQERVNMMKSDSEKELVKRFLDILRLQQELSRGSQSEDNSLVSQSSQPASQLEHHVSRADSMTDSQRTVTLGDSDEDTEDEDKEHAPVVNMNSIERVVSSSESFSRGSSQKTLPDTQDKSVADILAALLEESGPPPSNLASLEDQDSILNQSIILGEDEEKEEEEETLLMSQVIHRATGDGRGLDTDVADFAEAWGLDKDADVVMNSDDDDDNDDDDDCLPQFDGASDKITGAQKKSDESQIPSTINPSAVNLPENVDTPQSDASDTSTTNRLDATWRAGTAGRVMGPAQGFPGSSGSWPQQGWPQQSAPGGGTWPAQGSTWSQQQQQYQNWPQQMSPSAFPSQQAPFHPPSPAASFQSPPHNSYASPTHQQTYQTPSPSTSHHQYQYPPYQSPTSSQTYQQPYQSPSQHSYQSQGSSQTFHSPQSYHSSSSNQAYQSPSTSQPYSPLATSSQPYQLPTSGKPYMSPPRTNQPYQSPQGSAGYQSTGGTMYPAPYQSPPLSHHSSPQQPFPPPYQSPSGRYPSQSSWSPQGYPGYFQGITGSQVTGSSRKHSPGSTQPDPPFRQPGGLSLSGFQSQDLQQQLSPGSLKQQQIDVNTSTRTPSSHNMAGLEAFASTSPDISQPQKKRKGGRKSKESTKLGGFKSPQPPLCLSPTSVVCKSPFESTQPNPAVSSTYSSNMCTPPMASGVSLPQSLLQDHTTSPHATTEDSTSFPVIPSSKSSLEPPSVTKISTLEFRPNSAPYSVAPVNILASPSSQSAATTKEIPGMHADKLDTGSSTPMIQQLLMEEPVRMNIRKEDRDAVMKKPMVNPTPPKPRKKYTRKSTQSGRKPGRPRSMSLSSPSLPAPSYYGYPQPMLNSAMMGQQEKQHPAPHSFSCEPRMPSLPQNYAWQQQQQWKQQNFLPGSQWQQQQQQQQHWGTNDWQMYNNLGDTVNSGDAGNSYLPMPGRLQQRSLSTENVQSPVYDKTSQLEQPTSFPDNQTPAQDSIDQTTTNREISADKSSLSSLFQLVSDVGSETIDWENEPSTVVPNLFPNSSESETTKSTPTPDLNQESPTVKDFITLETPYKQDLEKANSDAATSSEESDHSELKPSAVCRSGIGSCHPRLGKQSRLKKLGLLPTDSTNLGSFSDPAGANPAYTYTFHVPTPVFKKLKFFRSADSRRHNINVVRMHPMDARRYSLLKVGREIVKAVRLTEVDLAQYNVSLPSPSYPFVSADGSTNRVNLDIPVVSVDRRSGDSGSEESNLSKFDTDFPPNKVAPPSFFNASQVSASLTRATSTATRGSPGSSDWMRQHAGLPQVNFNGRYSSGSLPESCSPQQASFSPPNSSFPFLQQQRDGNSNTLPTLHQQMHQGNANNKQGGSQRSEDTSALAFQQFSQKGSSSSHPHPASSSSSQLPGNYYPSQHGLYMNHIPYPPQQPYYQQHEQYQLQQPFPQHQPQANYIGSNTEPKNGLRSPSQHGLISKIDSGRVRGHSDDQVTDLDMDTTVASPINTRVNAHSRVNHAEHMANQAATLRAGLCNTTHSPAVQSSECDDDNSDLNKGASKLNNLNSFDEKHSICRRKVRSLSLKRSGGCDKQSTQDLENGSVVAEKDSFECCDMPPQPAHLTTTLKHIDINTSLNGEHGWRRQRTNCRKNVKALRLTIPHPLHHDYDVVNRSLSCQEKNSTTSPNKDSSVDGNMIDSRDFSPSCRSTRCSSIEDDIKSVFGGRQSPRQAKLRSPYSKNMCELKPKRKRRKRQEPQIEGVHYIVIGKFRGHQAMLVKINKLNVSTVERVNASLFEESSAKEIVREISPQRCLEDRLRCVQPRAVNYHSNSSTEDQSDTDSPEAYLGFDQRQLQTPCTSQTFQKPSRGRSSRYGRFRSTCASLTRQGETPSDSSPLGSTESESQPQDTKNGLISDAVLSSSTNGTSKNVTFLPDNFFVKFKENFTLHNKAKQVGIDTRLGSDRRKFFEGVQTSSFENFHRIFLANVERIKSVEYSSSSDDEEDIIDGKILKEKFSIPEVSLVYRANRRGSYEEVKKGQSPPPPWIREFELKNGSNAIPQIQINEDTHFDSSKLDLNDCLIVKQCGLSASKDAAPSSDDDRTLSPDVVNPCYNDPINTNQEPSEALDEQSSSMTNFICEVVPEQDVNTTAFSEVERSNIDQKISLNSPSTSILNTSKDNEEKEDYLKSQMAFFEDISSDSDSYGTVIMDSLVGAENTSQPDISATVPELLFSNSAGNKLSPAAAVMDVHSDESLPGPEYFTSTREDVLSKDTCVASLVVETSPAAADSGHSEIPKPDLRSDSSEISDDYSSWDKKLKNGYEQEIKLQVLDTNVSDDLKLSVQEFSGNITDNVLSFSDQNKDVLSGSDEATIELDMGADEAKTESNKNSTEQLNSSKASDPNESQLVGKSAESDIDHDTSISSQTCRRQKKHGKGMKKSKRDKGSQLVTRRHLIDEANSSSNDEASVVLDSFAVSENKCLRQRKQTLYYTDILDSTEDDSSDSSDEDFHSRGSQQRKCSKSNRRQKGVGLKDRQIQKVQPVLIDAGKVAKSSPRARPSRGKKKKTAGGDKLLNSLSLLHMATLANLTEVQSEPLGGQTSFVTTIRTDNEHSLQCSNIVNSDYLTSFPPLLDHASFISPQTAGEFATQPVACSPTDKKRWKQTGAGNQRGEDNTSSRRLNSLRPGCNGASNLGTKPLPFSRLMTNSASPIPSNFSFGHISDPSTQSEPTRQNEDTGTPNTLQLLETRRAQVNCASFSMKDILKLTTPDDSMDSDSKDSAALIRPPEPKRAQVKSTTLSMSDILKLTCSEKSAELETTQSAPSIFSLLSNPGPLQTQSQALEAAYSLKLLPAPQSCQDKAPASSRLPPEAGDSTLSSQAPENIPDMSKPCISQEPENIPDMAKPCISQAPENIPDMSKPCISQEPENITDLSKPCISQEPQKIHDLSKPCISQAPENISDLSKPCISQEPENISDLSKPCISQEPENISDLSKPCISQEPESIPDLSKPCISQEPENISDMSKPCISPEPENLSSHSPLPTEASQSLLDQIMNFTKSAIQKPSHCEKELPPTKKNTFSSTQTATCLSLQSGTAVRDTIEKAKQIQSSLSTLHSCDTDRNAGGDKIKNDPTQSPQNTNTLVSETKTSATDFLPNCTEITPDLPAPQPAAINTPFETHPKHEQLSPSLKSPYSVKETQVCRFSSPEVLSPLLLDTHPTTSRITKQQRKTSKPKKLIETERLAFTADIITVPKASKMEEPSTLSAESPSKTTSVGKTNFSQKSPHLNVPKSSISSVLEIPKISVTFADTSLADGLEGSHPKLLQGKAKRKSKTKDNLTDKDNELKPLHPLQIPPHSLLGHGLTAPQVFHNSVNPSLYYPFCWQWPFHTPGSDPAVSPLNLCTIQKSATNYSPITPTSPISPNYPTQPQRLLTSIMSPPLKKAKPLWYPWLTVDSARNKSEPKVSDVNQRDSTRHNNFKAENENNHINQANIDQTTPVSASTTTENCRQALRNKLDAKIISRVQKNCSSRLASLLSSSPQKPNSINSDKLSNCQTVSQFLGTVIETAYEQGNNGRIVPDNNTLAGNTEEMTGTSLKPSTAKIPNATKNNQIIRNSEHPCGPSDAHWKGGTSHGRQSLYQTSIHQRRPRAVSEQVLRKADNEKSSQADNEGITRLSLTNSEKTRVSERMEKDEDTLSSSLNSFLPNHTASRSVCLTDRLITKLIKGDGFEYHHHVPVEASGSKKQPDTPSKKRNSSVLNRSQSSKEEKPDKEKVIDNEGEISSRGKERKLEKILAGESSQELILCPVKPPPKWAEVEDGLRVLGLNSVQPPAAFCSNVDDLPSRPVEHGGRVLKVESKRLFELSAFTPSQCIIGIKIWRSQSLSFSTLLSSQGRPLWERLEQEPQLRFLLAGDEPVVVSPVCTPPSRTSIQRWLHDKMVNIKHTTQSSLQQSKFNEGRTVDSASLKDRQMSLDKNSLQELSEHTELASAETNSQDKKLDESVSETGEIGSSQLSPSDVDCSALVDTDLDISCNLTTTPARLGDSTQSSFLALPTPSSQEFPHTSPVVRKAQRKLKLRFVDDGCRDASEETSPTDSVDENFQIKKRKVDLETPAASSTPVKPLPVNPCDLTSISASSQQEHTQSSSPSVKGRSGLEAADFQQVPLLRHISTNTESLLRKSILTSQTQRQSSFLGLNDVSQIEGPTPRNSFGFKVMQTHMQDSKALHKYQSVTVLSLELHIDTRGDLRPDPEFDAIHALFYSVLNDTPPEKGKRMETGVIIVDSHSFSKVSERQKVPVADPSNLPSTSHCAAFKDSLPTPDHLPSSPARSKPMPNLSDQTASTDHHKATSSSKMQASQPSSSSKPVPSKEQPGSSKEQPGSSKEQPVSSKEQPTFSKEQPTSSKEQPSFVSDASVSSDTLLEKCAMGDLQATYVMDEVDLINHFTQLVTQLDPDILVGFEIQMLSWGYLLQRAAHLNIDLSSKISRVQDAKNDNRFSAEKDEWGADHTSEIHVAGRIVLNLWRVLRHEVTLNVYSFENVAYHVLHQRIPLYSFRSLSKWYNHKTHLHRWRVFEHYVLRVKGQLEVIEELDLIGKTSEFARVFGLLFYDVLARGSQIRVESMMLRLAKPMNFVPLSPGVQQRARQRAPECIPLNLEPESKFYTSPVAVLDFQSLYPSIMIAYNYCYTTCLGRLDFLEKAHEGPYEFGCSSLNLTPTAMEKICDQVTVSPNGVAFLKSSVRRGVLPIMVEEILNTRLMVKKSIKKYKNDKILSRMLDARQLGLKLIANVTYGYTNANYSGRMPCIEVADSIVRKARESLERAIELVRSTPRWGAHVVYGDTDSMFIHFPGRSKDEAFVLGQEIADAVTAMFPSPIKLRFEKVYLPCVLQTKKRYVGFMYETADQKEPVYDAKGIETVRRDACSAVSKILERSIKVLFSTHDLSRVRAYVTRQLHKLLEGKVSIIDLIFAKEYRGMMAYKPGACIPALEIARRRLRLDRKSEPRVGERVPYVIVHGSPGLPLIQLVKEPSELVVDTSLRLNANYYISKQILPPLDRIFSLIGVNVFRWHLDMPKVVRVGPMIGAASSSKQGTISQFFATTNCPVCETQTKLLVCELCRKDPQVVAWKMTTKIRDWEKTYNKLLQVCYTCQGTQDSEQACVSIDCPIMFRRITARQDLIRADSMQEVLTKYLTF